jgi:signal transduction histidine kinase/DNA-binding response OmpR family regulator
MMMTTDGGTADLPAALDLAAFEQVADSVFRPIGRLPAWLRLESTASFDLAEEFPILEIFLPDCEPAWAGGKPLESDIWTEPDGHGGELYLQAVATALPNPAGSARRLLILRPLPQALFTYQQLAHDLELQKEQVERLSRELELKRQEAERATRAKSDFLATMSHEIRTPLNAVIGMADVLAATPLTREQLRCVEVSQRNGVGLLTLINDILDLAKVEAGRVELEMADMDLRDVIARASEVVEGRALAKGLALRHTIAPDVPVYLRGDPNRLRQILINLLGNSIKFTDKGELAVSVTRNPEGHPENGALLRFAVSDTGIGIPPDKVNQVFESFTQADSSTTRKYGGTGLGLTVSKQLVELMGGRIWVESQPGAGSTFFFTAKLGVQEDQSDRGSAQRLPASPVQLEPLLSGMRILLADDSEDNRFLILSYLKRARCAIDVAEDGEAAVRQFRPGKYDVILMDVEMPVMDGYMAIREIRRLERESGAQPAPVLALTAHAFAEMAQKGFEAGFTDLLTKPIRSLTLLEALARHFTPKAGLAADTVRIVIEEGMEDVAPAYLDKRRAEISTYRQALESSNFDAIRMLAHKMKGTGAGYGFPVLTDLGSALEAAAKRGDRDEIQIKLDEFDRYVHRVELEYSK